MTRIFYHAEQTGNVVTFFDSAGMETCLQTDLEAYIEANRLNVTDTYGGNSGSGEPWNELDSVEQIEAVEVYLDKNWDSITLEYWNEHFNK